MLKVGDTVVEKHTPLTVKGSKKVGLVIEVLRSEIYDRGERIIVVWSCGGKTFEKESHLEKRN
mgnify:CR=1 FL=1